MKIKRRWKVMAVLPMVWCIIGLAVGIPLYEHGYEAWIGVYSDSLLMFGGWFLGTITGVILFVGAIEAEERENADFKFKDDVYEHYNSVLGRSIDHDGAEGEAVNKTAIHFDTSPSHVRNIVKVYKA